MSSVKTSCLAVLIAFATGAHAGTSSDKIKKLAPCPARATPAPAGEWKVVQVRERLSLSLPAGCERAEATGFVHGGDVWRCGEVGVQVAWGMWGGSSFGEGVTTCAATIGGTRVMVAREKGNEGWVAVLYPTDEVHEPLVSASSPRPEDRALVETIVSSGRMTRARKK